MTWLWYELGRHPDAEARLAAECAQLLAGRDAAAHDLDSLGYLRAALAETMRLYPADTVMTRRVVGRQEVGDRRLPDGATLYVVPWVLHRDQRWWPDADEFRPERWESVGARARRAYLPWGHGPHVCIGRSLAELQMPLVVAGITQRFRLALRPADAVVDPTLVAVNILPDRPVMMSPRARPAVGSTSTARAAAPADIGTVNG